MSACAPWNEDRSGEQFPRTGLPALAPDVLRAELRTLGPTVEAPGCASAAAAAAPGSSRAVMAERTTGADVVLAAAGRADDQR